MPDHEPLQPPRRRVQARQAHELAFDLLPLGQGIDEETLVPVDGDDQFPLGEFVDLHAVTRGHDHPSLVVQGDLCCTAKHDVAGENSPIPPHFLPPIATMESWTSYVKQKS